MSDTISPIVGPRDRVKQKVANPKQIVAPKRSLLYPLIKKVIKRGRTKARYDASINGLWQIEDILSPLRTIIGISLMTRWSLVKY